MIVSAQFEACPICGRNIEQPPTGRRRLYCRSEVADCKRQAEYERRRHRRLVGRLELLADRLLARFSVGSPAVDDGLELVLLLLDDAVSETEASFATMGRSPAMGRSDTFSAWLADQRGHPDAVGRLASDVAAGLVTGHDPEVVAMALARWRAERVEGTGLTPAVLRRMSSRLEVQAARAKVLGHGELSRQLESTAGKFSAAAMVLEMTR